ncbi:hypothetical protein PVAP13_2NG226400 [Panicum virgatum]|uniref:Uncharacterized protein n=1 Tax=Panicum virgatum TaxID=38727 RepID=A0A8T0VIG7_PANVG|nr:hypothetical protein PVAP13_2NG226400 [Panicum virgatum]
MVFQQKIEGTRPTVAPPARATREATNPSAATVHIPPSPSLVVAGSPSGLEDGGGRVNHRRSFLLAPDLGGTGARPRLHWPSSALCGCWAARRCCRWGVGRHGYREACSRRGSRASGRRLDWPTNRRLARGEAWPWAIGVLDGIVRWRPESTGDGGLAAKASHPVCGRSLTYARSTAKAACDSSDALSSLVTEELASGFTTTSGDDIFISVCVLHIF